MKEKNIRKLILWGHEMKQGVWLLKMGNNFGL